MRRTINQTTIGSIFGINQDAIGVSGTTRRSVLLRRYQQSYTKASALAKRLRRVLEKSVCWLLGGSIAKVREPPRQW